jgi:hypothetical protein
MAQIGAPLQPHRHSPGVRWNADKGDACPSVWQPCLARTSSSCRVLLRVAAPLHHWRVSRAHPQPLPWLRLALPRANATAATIAGRAELHGCHPTSFSAPSPSRSSAAAPPPPPAALDAPLPRPRWPPASSTDGAAVSSTTGARGLASMGPLHLSHAPQHLHHRAPLLRAWGSQPLPPSCRCQHATPAIKPSVTVVRRPRATPCHAKATCGCTRAPQSFPAASSTPARPPSPGPASSGNPPLFSSVQRKGTTSPLSVSLWCMTSGPGWTMGPTCQFNRWLVWVCNRVNLAIKLGFDFFCLLNYKLVLPYLILGNSKNSKCGLFGNLEKIYLQ